MRVVIAVGFVGAVAGCRAPDASKSDAAASASASSASAVTSSASTARALPPADAASTCVVTLTGKTGEHFGKPALEYTMKNNGTRAFESCSLRVYAYDAAGTQVSTATMSTWMNFDALAPGASRSGYVIVQGEGVIGTHGVTFEPVVDGVMFADGSQWTDFSLSPRHRPRGGTR